MKNRKNSRSSTFKTRRIRESVHFTAINHPYQNYLTVYALAFYNGNTDQFPIAKCESI